MYCRLLGLFDAIWSTVRSLHSGLLPTIKQKRSLENGLKEAKTLWLKMKLSTLQPKWHLTFDGHHLDQFSKYGGHEAITKQSRKTKRAIDTEV